MGIVGAKAAFEYSETSSARRSCSTILRSGRHSSIAPLPPFEASDALGYLRQETPRVLFLFQDDTRLGFRLGQSRLMFRSNARNREASVQRLPPPSTSPPSGQRKYLGMAISSTGTSRTSSTTLNSPFLKWLAGSATQTIPTQGRRGAPSVHRPSATNPLSTVTHSRPCPSTHSPRGRPGVRAQAIVPPLDDALDGDVKREITVGVHGQQHTWSCRKEDHYRLITVNGRHEPSRRPKRARAYASW